MKNHTPGPWAWHYSGGQFDLCTMDRGRLMVMGFARMGMHGAQPTFFKWEGENRERKGGLRVKAEDMGELHDHPDARLIAYAPDLLAALKGLVTVCKCQNGCAPDDMTCETNRACAVIRAVEGVKQESPK